MNTLISDEKNPGVYEVQWDGTNQDGHSVGSGVFFYVLKQGKVHIARKLILER